MNLNDMKQQILQIFSETLFIEVESTDLDLIEGGLLDSLVFVDLIMNLQQQFQIEISVAEIEFDEFRSVNRIADYVHKVLNPAVTTDAANEVETASQEQVSIKV